MPAPRSKPATPTRDGAASSGDRPGRPAPGGVRPKPEEDPRWRTFRYARIGVLLVVLIVLALSTWAETRRITSWKRPLTVVLHPIAAEAEVAPFVKDLDASAFATVEPFFDREAKRWGLALDPHAVRVELGRALHELPPPPPTDPSLFAVISWSLSYRWWGWQTARKEGLEPADVRLFLAYHAPSPGRALEHSLGIAKARSGVAHLFAAEGAAGTNAVVIAHELLHLAGASDRYDEAGRPRVPDGLGEPERAPRYPQVRAEIMAGSIAVSETESKLPDSLESCVVGPETARELGWRE